MIPVQARPFAALDPQTLYRILRLRSDVFVVEQRCAYADLDGQDTEAATLHLWVDLDPDGPTVSAAARLLRPPAAPASIGRVVTAASRRRQGLAGGLIDAALDHLEASTPVRVNAQAHLETWYGRWRFVRNGPEFLEDGIPHVPMLRTGR